MAPKISVVLCSAREDYSLVDLPETHLFEPTMVSLVRQTFQDFEVIVVDGLYSERSWFGPGGTPKFPIKHISPKYSPYAKKGQWSICNSFNSGLIQCEGELVVRIDDASEFSPDYLQRIWNWHTANPDFGILSLVNYYRGGKIARWDDLSKQYYAKAGEGTGQVLLERDVKKKLEMMRYMYEEGHAIIDSRLPQMTGEVMLDVPWDWVYGYVALPLEKFLMVNGYDEAFDGKKSLEDPDLALRLKNADPKTKFILDKGLWAVENFHGPASKDVIFYEGKPACCNYAIMKLHQRDHWTRANERRFTDAELGEIKGESIRLPCSHEWGKDYDLGEGFAEWARDIPTFDLRQMRKELRTST